MGRAIVAGGARASVPVTFPANFMDATWEQIIDACQKNKVPDTWLVADQKAMTINGTDYLIDIIGKNHDTYSDGSGTAPLTFQMHYGYINKYAMNSSKTSSGGWISCDMRSTYLPAILALMDYEISSAVKEVIKYTSAGSQSAIINTSNDKLFLLSEIEVNGSVQYSYSGEGMQYDYYAAGNDRAKRKVDEVSTSSWWLRSPRNVDVYGFCNVNPDGSCGNNPSVESKNISFAFCF